MHRQASAQALFLAALGGFLLGVLVCNLPAWTSRRDAARTLCERWADDLDRDTTDAGVYVRFAGDTLPETDPWGRPLQVSYSRGGLAECLEVRSLGADGKSHTRDDVVARRWSANLAGVKAGAEETAADAARGAVQGAADGVKAAARAGNKAASAKP